MGSISSGLRRIETKAFQLNVARARTGLTDLGVGTGDAVALILRNEITFFEAVMAVGAIGAYPVTVNWHSSLEEARYILTDCRARVVIVHSDLFSVLAEAIPDDVDVLVVATPPEVKAAYALADTACDPPGGVRVWDEWRNGYPPTNSEAVNTPMAVMYTSGTTGRPKGVRRAAFTPEQAADFTKILSITTGLFDYVDCPDSVVALVTGPLYHAAPFGFGTVAVRMGAHVVCMPRFDPEEFLRHVEADRVTHVYMAPIMFVRLLRLPETTRLRYDLSSLKFVVHAGSPCAPDVKRAMIDWLGPIVHEYYGGTEIGAISFCTAEEWLKRPGTVGKVLEWVDFDLIDPDGKTVPVGSIGEIICATKTWPDFTYENDPELRMQSELRGLIRPGDMGYVDADNYLYITGRAKDMIISGGVNIYPAEIEAELIRMPSVKDCAVFGIPDSEYGESICAHVVPQEGCYLDPSTIKSFLKGKLASFKIPRRIEIVADLPREDSGKIFKKKIRAPYWNQAGREI